MPEKFYSVEEANALVPKLQPLLERIRATQEALAKDKTVAAVREKPSHNGGGLPPRHRSQPPTTLRPPTPQHPEWGHAPRHPSLRSRAFPPQPRRGVGMLRAALR